MVSCWPKCSPAPGALNNKHIRPFLRVNRNRIAFGPLFGTNPFTRARHPPEAPNHRVVSYANRDWGKRRQPTQASRYLAAWAQKGGARSRIARGLPARRGGYFFSAGAAAPPLLISNVNSFFPVAVTSAVKPDVATLPYLGGSSS